MDVLYIHYILFFHQGLIVDVLDGHSKEWSTKDLQLMINTINFLSKELDSDSSEVVLSF